MPEHETFDFETAFARLERDIADITSPHGARLAVATARRRRRTTYGAIAAAAVLAVGGFALGHGPGGRNGSIAPADQPLPPPTPLSAATLSTATAGWVDGWGEAATNQATAMSGVNCLATAPGDPGYSPTRQGTVLYTAGTSVSAAVVGTEYAADQIGAAASALTDKVTNCHPTVTATTSYTDGSQVTYYQLPGQDGMDDVELWTGQFGNRLGLGVIAGSGDAPSPDVVGRVDDLVMGALQVDSTVTQAPGGPGNAPGATVGPSGGRIDPAKTLGQVWAEDLGPALAGWDNPWEPQLRDITGPELPPCAGQFDGDANGRSETVNVGRNGHEWVQWFDDETAATTAVEQLQQNLASCSTPYTFHTVTLPDARPVLVGVGPDVLWIERVASHALFVYIAPGSTPPPDAVSLKVGAVLEHVLEQPATTTVSPDSGTTVPQWMQKEIAAAPTYGP
jgi:hypothetical protein